MKQISTFGKRIKAYRKKEHLTLTELSKKIDIPAQTINRYELEQRSPKIDVANNIAEKLNINSLWLQGFDVSIDNEEKEEIPKEFTIMARKVGDIPEEHRKQLYRTLRRTIDSFLEDDNDDDDLEDF